MRHVSTIAEPQRSTCLKTTKKEVKTIPDKSPITQRMSHFNRSSYWIFLGTDDDEWAMNIHDIYNEHGIKSSFISATVKMWGMIATI